MFLTPPSLPPPPFNRDLDVDELCTFSCFNEAIMKMRYYEVDVSKLFYTFV